MSFLPFCQSAQARLQLGQGLPAFLGKQGLRCPQLRLERGLQHRPQAQALLDRHAAQQACFFLFCEFPTLSQ